MFDQIATPAHVNWTFKDWLLLAGFGGATLLGLGYLIFSRGKCSRLRDKFQHASRTGNRDEADEARYEGAGCDWAEEAEQKREIERYRPARSPQPWEGLAMAEADKPKFAERKCGCKIVKAKSKGGSTRFAAKCADSKMTQYVSKEFAKRHKNKGFCIKTLKPFNPLTGRLSAFRMWAMERRRRA